ncbi:aspartyl protease family protein [Sphingomonas sp.]|uniref:aspartyl protease family protein n=1 Tax=Sphingomonas sp. TaxID=28214 RepID=UPI001E0BA790|nr:aspartyl protease family protein [Sphingomonas sp.]MBX9797461.1 aspartyl protease family protein [Sphingomonas sp.]
MRLMLIALMLPLCGAVPVPVAPQFQLTRDAEDRWIAFDMTDGNQIAFTAAVNGVAARAILDTGVSNSTLSPGFAARARLKVVPRGRAQAIGGTVAVGWAATRHVAVGAMSRTGGGLTIAALPAIATGDGTAADLLVGRDLLAGYALDIDYPARRFRLLPTGRLPFTGATAPLTIARDPQVYVTELTLAGQRLRPVLVDTGDGAAATLSQDAWRRARVSGITLTTTIGYGLAGPQESELGIVPEIAVGGFVARNIELRVEPPGGFSQAIGMAGRIGTGFFQRHRVLLDPGAGRMVLAEATGDAVPPLRSTSGLLTRIDRDRLTVIHVMRHSPAAEGGWRGGDQICRVDGLPAAGEGLPSQTDWQVGTPGRQVTLTLCSGEERRLTLSAFY